MGNFGYEIPGGDPHDIDYYSAYCKFQMDDVADQQAVSITWYLTGDEPRGFKVALYDAGLNLLGQGTGTKSGDGWITVTLDTPVPLTALAFYWLGGMAEEQVANYKDAGAANQSAWISKYDLSYANFPRDPMNPSAYGSNKWSVYCTYEAVPPPTPAPRSPATGGLDPMVF